MITKTKKNWKTETETENWDW